MAQGNASRTRPRAQLSAGGTARRGPEHLCGRLHTHQDPTTGAAGRNRLSSRRAQPAYAELRGPEAQVSYHLYC